MKNSVDFDDYERAERFAKQVDGDLVKVKKGSIEFYRVYFYE